MKVWHLIVLRSWVPFVVVAIPIVSIPILILLVVTISIAFCL